MLQRQVWGRDVQSSVRSAGAVATALHRGGACTSAALPQGAAPCRLVTLERRHIQQTEANRAHPTVCTCNSTEASRPAPGPCRCAAGCGTCAPSTARLSWPAGGSQPVKLGSRQGGLPRKAWPAEAANRVSEWAGKHQICMQTMCRDECSARSADPGPAARPRWGSVVGGPCSTLLPVQAALGKVAAVVHLHI